MKVAVVGAGPAGASAGYHLARAGHSVTLLDACGFPRPKVCGDWITRGALSELMQMGVPRTRLRAAARSSEIRGARLGAPNGQHCHVKLDHSTPGACVPREIFDALLVERATETGCTLERHRVRDPSRLLDDHQLVVDARGVYAGQANTVSVRAYWTLPTTRTDALTRSAVQLFTLSRVRMGYAWIFPVHVTRTTVEVNLGVGVWREEHDERGLHIRREFEHFINEHPVAKRLAAVAIERGRSRGHHLALSQGRVTVAQGGILRVGDAANLTDPITGEGIANAVLSGRLVAQAIDGARNHDDAQLRWQRAYERTMLPELDAALRLRRALLGTRRKNLAMWLLRRNKDLAARFVDSLEGVVSYADVLPLPRWPRWGRP